MSKILRNDSASPVVIVDVGSVTINAGDSYTINPNEYPLFAASSNTVTFIGNGDLTVNDGSFDLTISDGVDLIKGLFPPTQVEDTPHLSGFRGYPILGVRNDADAALTDANLDWSPVAVDEAGRLKTFADDDQDGVTVGKIENVTLAANTEAAHTFPSNTKAFLIRSRNGAPLKIAHTASESGTVYWTITPGGFYGANGIRAVTTTIYVQSPVAGTILELESWV